LRQVEELRSDDLVDARLTYHHALRQYLGYALPFSEELKTKVIPEISAACLLVDRMYYKKKKKGKGHDRFNARVEKMTKDLERGLVGDGVLERYVPTKMLQMSNRSSLAKHIMKAFEKASAAKGYDEGVKTEMLLKSRALGLMQTKLPNYSAYVWNGVTNVAKGRFVGVDLKWENLKWTEPGEPLSQSPGKKLTPKESIQLPGGNDKEYMLLVDEQGLELRARTQAEGFRIPYRRGGAERRHLAGWRTLPGGTLALCAVCWQDPPNGEKGSFVPQALALRIPEGAPEPVARLIYGYA